MIGDVAWVGTGATPRRGEARYYENGSIPWVTSGVVNSDEVVHATQFVTEDALRETNLTIYKPGTLLVAMYGEGKTRGKCSVLQILATTNQALAAIVLAGTAEQVRKWLVYTFERNYHENRKLASGGVQPNLNLGLVRGIETVLPPLPEQHRIVAALESHLSRLDDAIASLERVQRNLKRYRASVLKAAVEGRLVPTEAELARQERRDYEPASVLLERILVERKKKWIEDAAEKRRGKAEKAGKPWTAEDDAKVLENERAKAAKKYKEPEPPDTEDLPELPEGWCWVHLDQCMCSQAGFAFRSQDFIDEGVNLLRGDNIGHGRLRWDAGKRRCIAPTDLKKIAHLQLTELDIVLAMDRPVISTGLKIAVVRGIDLPALLVQRVLRIRPLIDHRYLYFNMRSQAFTRHLNLEARGGGVPHVSETQVQGFGVPLPPLKEQLRIASELDRIHSIADDLERTSETSIGQSHRLRQSILKWAFEGRLVDQDPNDEPAPVLLERIKAEKAATEPKPKTGRKGRRSAPTRSGE